jgi:hypothetical protein
MPNVFFFLRNLISRRCSQTHFIRFFFLSSLIFHRGDRASVSHGIIVRIPKRRHRDDVHRRVLVLRGRAPHLSYSCCIVRMPPKPYSSSSSSSRLFFFLSFFLSSLFARAFFLDGEWWWWWLHQDDDDDDDDDDDVENLDESKRFLSLDRIGSVLAPLSSDQPSLSIVFERSSQSSFSLSSVLSSLLLLLLSLTRPDEIIIYIFYASCA